MTHLTHTRSLSRALAAVLTLTFSAVLAAGDTAGAMDIAVDGAPAATIVVAADANEVVMDAVADLQRCIEKISGATLPISNSADVQGNVILVGRMPVVDRLIPELDSLDLGNDGVVIKLTPGKLILTGQSDGYNHQYFGRTDCGTPNAVYCFLESLGCRWYLPGDDGEIIPSHPTLTVTSDVDLVHKPHFFGRGIGSNPIWYMWGQDPNAKGYRDFELWKARNRSSLNTWHEGHGMDGLMPKATYAKTHPEYFALYDGKRQPNAAGQFCLSNSEVVDLVAKRFVHLLHNPAGRGEPIRSYPLGQYDSWLWCQCPGCKAMYGDKTFTYTPGDGLVIGGVGLPHELKKQWQNVANGYLKFVNAIAERVEKVDPDVMLTYYGVYNTAGFPEVRPRPNVLPVVCHIAPDFKPWVDQVLKWETISDRLYYYAYNGHRIALPKFQHPTDVRWCYEHKGMAIRFTTEEISPVNHLSLYLAAKALWDTSPWDKTTSDPDKATAELLAEFYTAFYGRAHRPLRQFWQTYDRLTRKAREWDCHSEFPPGLTPVVVARCRYMLEKGMKLAKDPVVQRRIDGLLKYWRATRLQVDAQVAMNVWRKDKTPVHTQAAEDAIAQARAYIQSMYSSKTFDLRPRIGLLNGMTRELNKANAAG